jgi:hypothetical protein
VTAGLIALGAAIVGGYALHATGTPAKLAGWFKVRFPALGRDVATALGGIGDALKVRNYRLALQIFWAVVLLEWDRGRARLKIWRNRAR